MAELFKSEALKARRMKSMEEVMEEVEVLIDTHFLNEFSVTQSSVFLRKVVREQIAIDINILKKTWRTPNCTPKTMKIIRDPGEPPLCGQEERAHHEEDRHNVLVQ